MLFVPSVFIFKLTSIPIVSNFIQQIARPPKILLYQTRVTPQDNNELAKENEKLQGRLVDYEKLKRDNQALRDQFETGTTSELKLLPARIVGSFGGFNHASSLIIDQGQNASVKKGMAVVIKNNLLGKVEMVSPHFSRISLTQNQKFQTLAKTSDTNALGIARGVEDFILFDQVSINDNVSPGQLVLTRGEVNEESFGIPPDLIIGKISSINKNESLPTQSAKVESIIDLSKVDLIFVVISL